MKKPGEARSIKLYPSATAENNTYLRRLDLQRFSPVSSWSVLAVRAARRRSVCVCVTDEWKSVSKKYSVTQESNVAASGFLTGPIVVEGDMFSSGKARPVLSPPSYASDPPPPQHPLPGGRC